MNVSRQFAPPNAPPKEEPSWFIVIIISGILCGMLLFTIGWFMTLPDPEKNAVMDKLRNASDAFPGMIGLNQSKVFLVMGVDMPPRGSEDAYKGVRTDTMMLVKTDARHHKINIVSIPRDCKVFIPGYGGSNKINSAFTFGGPELAVQTVEQTFGVEIDNYLVVNVRGVKEVVDALGGLDVYIEKPMHYRDNTAHLNINLEPGTRHLDGANAEGFIRFRHDALGDIGRIRRQQQFMSAFAAKLKDPSVLLQIKPLLTASNKYILTDMSTQDLIGLALFTKDLQKSDYQVATLPGRPSLYSAVSYWIIDPGPAEDVLNQLIVGIRGEGEDSHEQPTVGIMYTPNHADELQAYSDKLEERGFKVICKLGLRRTSTRLVTHNGGLAQETKQRLQHTNPALEDAQLIFAPHGATFETNSCGHSDYTIILGDDTRSAAN